MADFKIQVKLKNKVEPKEIKLNFFTTVNERGRVLLNISDGTERVSKISFDTVRTFVPSTLLSRWVTFYMKRDLLKLAGKGSSVEYMSTNGNTWHYRDNVQYFGLHDHISSKGKVLWVSIDDSIGMKKVIDIINAIGYDVLVDYDQDKGRMKSITLKEINYA